MSRVAKFLIVFSIVFFSVFIVRELTGHGLLKLADCNNRHTNVRCMNIGIDKATTPLQDFYTLIDNGDFDKAWHILPSDIQNTFIRSKGNAANKDYFHHFWDVEIEKFTVLWNESRKISSKSAEVHIGICYLRKSDFATAKKQPERFCSRNVFELQKRENATPYAWAIDTLQDYVCSDDQITACKQHDFSLPSQLILKDMETE